MKPRRNPNALPELYIRTESDEDEDEDETFAAFPRNTPAIPEVETKNNMILRNKVYPLQFFETGTWCWWCCHPFTTTRFFIPDPQKYSDRKKVFHVYGNFCSPNCAKAYLLYKRVCNMPNALSCFSLMCKKIFDIPISTPIYAAPPREMLNVFGGSLSIEEFRKKSIQSSISLVNKPLCVIVQDVHEVVHEKKPSQPKFNGPIHLPSIRIPSPKKRKREFHMKKERKQPVPQQPLKLLRKTKPPNARSSLTNFIHKTS